MRLFMETYIRFQLFQCDSSYLASVQPIKFFNSDFIFLRRFSEPTYPWNPTNLMDCWGWSTVGGLQGVTMDSY